MNELYFFDCHLLLDEQLISVQPQDWRNPTRQQAASTGKNLPTETTTTLVVPVGRSLYDQSAISGESPCWYSTSGSPSQSSLFGDRDFDGTPP